MALISVLLFCYFIISCFHENVWHANFATHIVFLWWPQNHETAVAKVPIPGKHVMTMHLTTPPPTHSPHPSVLSDLTHIITWWWVHGSPKHSAHFHRIWFQRKKTCETIRRESIVSHYVLSRNIITWILKTPTLKIVVRLLVSILSFIHCLWSIPWIDTWENRKTAIPIICLEHDRPVINIYTQLNHFIVFYE